VDRRLREAERVGDPVALLRARLRAGELTHKHVELAASLGHVAAREVCPVVALVKWGGQTTDQLKLLGVASTLLGDKKLPTRLAADWAEGVLPLFERQHPRDTRPFEAIAAARAWVACPCKLHYRGASGASGRADAAGVKAATKAARGAAEAASSAARGAFTGPKGAVLHHSILAAHMAVVAAAGEGGRTRAARAGRAAEREWQRLRLAAYVLGEVDLDEPVT
jgi:hypothetical protein